MLKSLYTIHRKAKRWGLRLFWYLVDTSVENFFILCCYINLGNAVNLTRFSDECSCKVTGSSFLKNCPYAHEHDPYTPKLQNSKLVFQKKKDFRIKSSQGCANCSTEP
jgi:hypothetical protein